MIAVALISLVLSAATCYALGYAYVAPRDAFVRSKIGIWVLILLALSFIPLPPQLLGLDSATASLGQISEKLVASMTWPADVSKTVYLSIWVISSAAASLAGLRIWNVGKPGWRASTTGTAYDTSKTGRMRALIVMADSLPEVLNIMARMGADAKSTQELADELRSAGARFVVEVPQSSAEAYAMVSAAIGPSAASVATRLLLEGAARARPAASAL